MSSTGDWNQSVIAEFRANQGRVGGPFAGAPMVLLHHRGRRSGIERVSPMVCLPAAADERIVHVMASKGGAPQHPGWYHNIVAAAEAVLERGTETYPVRVRDLVGEERDQVWAAVKQRFPGFGDYEKKTAGIRTIPVLELTRI